MLIPVLLVLIGALIMYAALKGKSPVTLVRDTLQGAQKK